VAGVSRGDGGGFILTALLLQRTSGLGRAGVPGAAQKSPLPAEEASGDRRVGRSPLPPGLVWSGGAVGAVSPPRKGRGYCEPPEEEEWVP